MGSCCCGERISSDIPEGYNRNRSCTDIIFALLFVVFWGCFVALGIVALKYGDLESVVHGNDYLGFECGRGDGPPDFESLIPSDALFQSKTWKENKFIWYPIPLSNGISGIIYTRAYTSLGVCVKECPKTNRAILSKMMEDPANVSDEEKKTMSLYPYGSRAVGGIPVNSPDFIYAMYDSFGIIWHCLPTIDQPAEVRSLLDKIPGFTKFYDFTLRGIYEVQQSWRVFILELGIAIALCLIFIFLMRLLISVIVWVCILSLLFLLAGGGGICFYIYYTKGNTLFVPISGFNEYPLVFLCVAIVLWCASLVYLFIIFGLFGKVRLVCALIKIASRVLTSSPTSMIIPVITSIIIVGVFTWSVVVAMALYSVRETKATLSLIPVTPSMTYNGVTVVKINETSFYEVTSQVMNSKHNFEYFIIADFFGFLWSMGFLNAACFTIIAFISVFWYFSSLDDSEKKVPFGGLFKSIFWTFFYHTGTIALGSFLVAIVQTIRFLLAYFAKKAKIAIGDNQLIACMVCYLQCFLAFFERVLSVINKNAYIMMCITSNNFCLSACSAISLILQHAVELLFLSCLVEFVVFIGKLFIISGCCVTGYFLCTVPQLAPGVDLKILPLIVIGVMAYIVSSAFFSVYSTTVDTLLVCYCYDRKINASRGFYYVPEELEHQISDYSQREKLRAFREKQSAMHNDADAS